MNGQVFARILNAETGALEGVVSAERADWVSESPSEFCSLIGAMRVAGAGYNVRSDYYEYTNDWKHSAALDEAWEMFSAEYHEDEAVEVMRRYVAAFRPNTVFKSRTVRTGYCQGDEVRLIAWVSEGEARDEFPDCPTYEALTRADEQLEAALEIVGAVARGQFWDVTVHEVVGAVYGALEVSDGSAAGEVELTLAERDSMLTLTVEEFNPIDELVVMARNMVPGCVLEVLEGAAVE